MPTRAVGGGVPEEELVVRAPLDCKQPTIEEETFFMNVRRGTVQKPTSGAKSLDSAW